MGILKNLGNLSDTNMTGGSDSKHFQDGKYIIRLSVCEDFEKRDRTPMFKIEGEVVATTSTHSDHPCVGQTGAQVFKGVGDFVKKDLMKFMCGTSGKGPKDLPDSTWDALAVNIFERKAMEGQLVYLSAVTKPQQADPSKSYTHHNWGVMGPERWAEFGVEEPAS